MMDDSEQVEILREFSIEVRDLLEQLEPSIIELGRIVEDDTACDPAAIGQHLNNIFRLFHSVKGTAGFLQLTQITNTAHVAENLLDSIRNGDRPIIPEHIDLFCEACDFTSAAVDHIDKHLNDAGMAAQAEKLVGKIEAALQRRSPQTPEVAANGPLSAGPAGADGEGGSNEKTLRLFLEEADEQLQEVEQCLLTWPNAVDRDAVIGKLFCSIHSFKGNCGFMDLADAEQLSHCVENILEAVKAGVMVDEARLTSMLLKQLDVLKDVLVDIGDGGSGEISGLERAIEQLMELLPAAQPQPEDSEDSRTKLGEILVEQGLVSSADLDKALEAQKSTAVTRRQDIRVDVVKLDQLITLIGELVIAENMMVNNPDLAGLDLTYFNKSAQHMSKIVKELQEIAMTVRMVPIAGLFRRMARVVHDLSRKTGKKVDLRIKGEYTEVDKSVIENVVDPLIHILRNAMDHGLESPTDRRRAGKPETGVIKLSARHVEGDVSIVISDDGRGLDRDKILAKAQQKRLVDGDGSQLSDRQVFNLIFLPGFSTAEEITEVSGRGVGMDVVRQNLAKIRGHAAISSESGRGTTIRLRIPLTMGIVDGMLVRTGATMHIVPILSIRESFRPHPDAITVTPDGQELVRLRDHMLPVVRLHELHNIQPDSRSLDQGILVVVEGRERHVCLFVDEIMGQQQTVIKGLSKYITDSGNIRGVSGCTILGDGNICLILDILSLVDGIDREHE